MVVVSVRSVMVVELVVVWFVSVVVVSVVWFASVVVVNVVVGGSLERSLQWKRSQTVQHHLQGSETRSCPIQPCPEWSPAKI